MDNKESRELIDELNKRLFQLKQLRRSYETVWKEILENCAPDLLGYIDAKQQASQGDREDSYIYDSTPQFAAQECAAGLYSFTTPRSRRWFKNDMDEKTVASSGLVRQFLDDVTDLQYKIMAASNFYDCKYVMKWHLVTVGTAVCVYYPDYDDVVRGEVLNIGEYWLGINFRNEHDTVFREFMRSARQLVDEFGAENVPESIKTAAKNELGDTQEHKVIHVICPNKQNFGPFPKKWLSAYYLADTNTGQFLKVGGFKFKPFEVSTWFRNRGEIYGKANPGRNVLPDMKQLQTMKYDWNESVAKINRPPMQGKADLLENGILDLSPAAMNELGGQSGPDNYLKPLFAQNPELESLFKSIEIQQEIVKKGFYIDKFQIVSMRIGKDMTATEVNRLASEALQVLAPVSENLNSEEFDRDIEIVFNYAAEAKIIPEPPEEIQGMSFEPQYVSSLTQAQKQADVNVTLEVVETAIGWANNSQDESILDSIDFDFALSMIGKVKSAPAGLILDPEIVAQKREARAQAQQAAQMGASLEQGARTLKTAGQAEVDGENVLSMLKKAGGQ